MMGARAGPHDDEQAPALSAERIVRDLTRRWDARGQEVDRLLDRVSGALADEANHELRQILTLVSTELELAERRSGSEGPIELERGTLRELLEVLDRGTAIVATYLDRNEAAKLLLQLTPEPLDLAELLDGVLAREGLSPTTDPMEVSIESATIHVDRDKVQAVLGFLVSRFWRHRPQGSILKLSLEAEGEGARGFIGLQPSPLSRGDLVERLEDSFTLDEIGIDVPYARALIERHGGSLFVDVQDDAVGYGFRLPPAPSGRSPR